MSTGGCELWALPDGMAAIYAVLPAPAAVACHDWLTALATRAQGTRRRADAGPAPRRRARRPRVDGLTDPDLPRRHGRPVQCRSPSPRPPCSGWTRRRASSPATDPSPPKSPGPWPGTPPGGGSSPTRPPAPSSTSAPPPTGHPKHLAELVIARDKTCRAPGCRIPARRCELDHSIRFPEGPTAAHNLGCGCKHDHRMKHETEWDVEQLPDATFIWTSPTGHHYAVPPEPFLDLPPPAAPDPPHQPDPPDPELDVPPF